MNQTDIPKAEKLNLNPDIPLFKAGQILTNTFRKNIYKDDCLEAVRKCTYEPTNTQGVIEQHEIQHEHNFEPKSNLTPYILLTALSVHGLFEGIALGLQTKDKEALFLAIAIISHKWAESFTLGVSFHKTHTEHSMYTKLILMFSCFTPFGIIAGMFLSGSNILIEAIFLSLSGGTFLYVSASEIIVEEFSVTKHKYSKYLLFIIGTVFVALLSLWETLSGIDG